MAATTQDQPDSSMMDLATPAASVSAFCRAVLNQLIPRSFFGLGDAGMSNWKTLMKAVDKFINLRRRETLSLHEVCQGVKVTIAAPSCKVRSLT
jgi:telomerase reverse transcriptase